MSEAPAIVWLRRDLRLADNPALSAALKTKRRLVFLYVLDDETPGRWRIGGASRWWLHKSLEALSADIAKRGGALVLRRGRAERVILDTAREVQAGAVYWNRCYEPYAIERDAKIKIALRGLGVEVETFNSALLNEPWTIKTKTGEPFKVFTSYWRACMRAGVNRTPLSAPKRVPAFGGTLAGDTLASWSLPPTKPNWAVGFEPEWRPGEAGAHATLAAFVDTKLAAYAEGRDELGLSGTSRLSPHLNWGEISPFQIVAAVAASPSGADKFLAELGWREFSTNLLFHWPTLGEENWRVQFDAFPWRDDEAALEAWRHGRTGYPVVDAAMRELWVSGFMHNRARMVVASFLIKHLMIDWRRGADWFWDTLVDADLAKNAASWQWVAGSGADASPYFRIFNPIAQGERYDADGAYVRRWLPQLAHLPNEHIHKPWDASARVLAAAGVRLGETYPAPIVDHAAARARALDAFATIRG